MRPITASAPSSARSRGDPDEEQQRGDNCLEGDLQQLDNGDDGSSGAEGAGRNPRSRQGVAQEAFSSTGNIREVSSKTEKTWLGNV